MIKRIRIVRSFALVALACGALAVAACGGASSGTLAGSTPGAHQGTTATASGPATAIPCSRVSTATVSAALGLHLNAPDESHAGSDALDTVCTYADSASAQIMFINYEAGQNAPLSYQAVIEVTGAADLEPVSGFGDKAFFDKGGATLHVLRGQLYFNVALFELNETDSATLLADAKQIATAILAAS